ncbi:MAG TPA: ATP-binding protein [Gemmatimonadaceae bacterium]|nr:ATP-binding protein [Gemmatimonadaceae bacterium]
MLPSPDDPRVPETDLWAHSPARWLAAIVESSDDAIIGKTLDSTIRSWNAGANRIFGYTADEIVGRSVLVLIPPECQHEETEIVSRLSRGERVDHFETVRVRKDGSRIDVSLSVSPIRDDVGRIVGAAKIARDLTESNRLRRAETELSEQLQQQAVELEMANEELHRALEHARSAFDAAEQANRAKSVFLRTMSHELRTPLNAIAGYVDLLDLGLRGELNPEQRRDLARIKQNQRTLLRLIEDVLDFARVESGRVQYHVTDVRLDDLLCELEAFVAPSLQQKRLEYHFEPCGPEIVARADRNRVEQIMLNLLSNAIKFTGSGAIEVRCAARKREILVEVHDSGRGIPPDMLDRVFEPFVQAHQDLTRTSEGTGLGLTISRRLARGMGGEVLASSEPGRGSVFTLVLPRAEPGA